MKPSFVATPSQLSLEQTLDSACDEILGLITSLTDTQTQVPCLDGINPPVWELGHCAFFFERFVLFELDGTPSLQPALDEIWDSFELNHEDRWIPGLFPNLHDTINYFNAVRDKVRNRIRCEPPSSRLVYLLTYAIGHLQMHMESLVWCRQTLGYPPPPGSRWPAVLKDEASLNARPGNTATLAANTDDIEIPAGEYRIGVDASNAEQDTFAFDCEKPAWVASVEPFSISRSLISNAEYLRFVESGGYESLHWWSRGGQRWLKQQKLRHPLYWKTENGCWFERIFDCWVPLQSEWPVRHISYREAQAYCNFAGRRLPTEIEWEVASLGNRDGQQGRYLPYTLPNYQKVTAIRPADIASCADMDRSALACHSVNDFQAGASPFGCLQMIGTLWEWTSSIFMPYRGFSPDMYPFMSTLQFGTHYVTRGGSFASASSLIRGTYRQAYLPERNDVFTGFRTCAP